MKYLVIEEMTYQEQMCAGLLNLKSIRLSMIFGPFYGDIWLSLCISSGISLSPSFVTISGLFCCEIFETFVLFWYAIIILLF